MLSRARTVAAKWITEGIAYLEARQIEAPLRYLQGLHALHLFDGGEWDAAEAAADRLLGQPEACGITQIFALLTHARLQTRRGLPDEASATLQTLWTVAETCGLLQHIGPAAAALGEHAVLHGRAETAIGPLRSARTLAVAVGAMPLVAELGFWLDRLGSDEPTVHPHPTRPSRTCCCRQATGGQPPRSGRQLGFPYERARTLAEADDVDALCTALEIADRLDAAPLAARVRARLRMLGVKAAPRAAQRHPRQPRRAHRAASRSAGTARRRHDRRRDRATARAVRAHGQPPRVLDPGQARRPVAPRRRPPDLPRCGSRSDATGNHSNYSRSPNFADLLAVVRGRRDPFRVTPRSSTPILVVLHPGAPQQYAQLFRGVGPGV